MSHLRIYADNNSQTILFESSEHEAIREKLNAKGVNFEQWQANQPVKAGDSQEAIINAYKTDIDKLMQEQGYITVDVVSLTADHPQKDEFRQKFLSEHTHSEDEVRFFVDGEGLFSLHIDNEVYEVLCQKGDLISVPANTTHWFDMGPNPNFVAIRLFNNPEGWVANFTGSDIATQFSRLEN